MVLEPMLFNICYSRTLIERELRAVGSIFGKTDNEYSGLIPVKYQESGSTAVHRDG